MICPVRKTQIVENLVCTLATISPRNVTPRLQRQLDVLGQRQGWQEIVELEDEA